MQELADYNSSVRRRQGIGEDPYREDQMWN